MTITASYACKQVQRTLLAPYAQRIVLHYVAFIIVAF